MRTFSKAYGLAGLRIGYGIAEKSLVSFLERTKQPFSVNMMALVAARAALGDESHLASVLENNRNGKKYLYDSIKGLGLDALPSEANFILIKIGPDAEGLTRQALRQEDPGALARRVRASRLYKGDGGDHGREQGIYRGAEEAA